jgi:hypothetical protein
VFSTPVGLSGSDSGRLDNEQLREAWSTIKRLITHGADTDAAIDAAFFPSCGWTGLAENSVDSDSASDISHVLGKAMPLECLTDDGPR